MNILMMFRLVKFYFGWLAYSCACCEEQIKYMRAQERGCYCEGFRGNIIYVFKFDESKPPQEKNWMEYDEYKLRWNPVNGISKFFCGPRMSMYQEMSRDMDQWSRDADARMKKSREDHAAFMAKHGI